MVSELVELSFVGNKSNKQWIWLALDVETHEIVGVHIGDRSEQGDRKLWDSLPSVYRLCAVAYTDFWRAYALVFPAQLHKAVGKESGKINYIERFNCTMRQPISRLVRKTLSFSKKLENHIAAIWFFIHHYNSSLTCLGLPLCFFSFIFSSLVDLHSSIFLSRFRTRESKTEERRMKIKNLLVSWLRKFYISFFVFSSFLDLSLTFPSPCGEICMKRDYGWKCRICCHIQVSIPLRGNLYETQNIW